MENQEAKNEALIGGSELNAGLGALPSPFAWMTHESKWRLANGGNCKAAVPVHGKRSATATIRLYTEEQMQVERNVWQSADTAPKDGTKILVFESCGEIAISHWFEMSHIEYVPVGDLFKRVQVEDGGCWNSNHFDFWMPLPEAPNVELTGSALLRSPS